MSGGGFSRLPDGSVVVALSLPRPPHGPRPGPGPGAGPGLGSGADTGSAADTGSGSDIGSGAGPYDCGCRVRVLVHAVNRQRALTRLRNLGLRSVYLRGNTVPPTPDEITAVLHHPDGLVWREAPDDDTESWHPIRALWRVPPPPPGPANRPSPQGPARAQSPARSTPPPGGKRAA
ncbi:hypothetical protein ACFY12_28595 [Streptomyces sp. NPDC001339]|uniref:hypothetical protein n=1 Tax=Streptomyces sp. NPDC001339 TaxID=3364563 RepID=UPI0036ABAD33